MSTPPPQGVREPMSAAEKTMRDKIRKAWIEKHTVWGPMRQTHAFSFEDFGARYAWYRNDRSTESSICVYTTERMFDGRFWVMRYRYVKVRRQWELERGTIRYRAKRKDAKAICLQLLDLKGS